MIKNVHEEIRRKMASQIVQLSDNIDAGDTTKAATPAAAKALSNQVRQLEERVTAVSTRANNVTL